MKNLLVTCGSTPHIIEFMIPTLREAKRQGWAIYGAYSDEVVLAVMRDARLFLAFARYTGRWDGRKLSIPLADAILKWVNPDAMLIDISGSGLAGGCWVEECYKREITAIEFHALHSHVWYYGKQSREATEKYIEVLKSVGYGGIPHVCMEHTPAMQFVGLTVGDQLLQPFDPGPTRELLGLDCGQKFATVCGTWNHDFYGQMCTEDLLEWSEQAKGHGLRLAFSVHPAMRTSQGLPKVSFPPDVILTSNVPGELWGQSMKTAPTIDLVRASEFLISQFSGALEVLGQIAQIPTWVRRTGAARGNTPSRETRVTEEPEKEEEIMADGGWRGFPWPLIDLIDANWRTQEHLDQLFAGTLGCKIPKDEWRKARLRWPAFVDGRVAERIVWLLTNG